MERMALTVGGGWCSIQSYSQRTIQYRMFSLISRSRAEAMLACPSMSV